MGKTKMRMANNYLKILQHLKEFEGDGKYHEIEHLLQDLTRDSIEQIILDLLKKGFIDKKQPSGYWSLPPNDVTFMDSNGRTTRVGGPDKNWKSIYVPYKVKITFEGSIYLKNEQFAREEQGMNISQINHSTVIVNSSKNKINIDNTQASSEIIDLTQNIIRILKTDQSISEELRDQHLALFQTLLNQAQGGKINKELGMKVLTVGDSVSSIGSFMLSLIQTLLPFLMRL